MQIKYSVKVATNNSEFNTSNQVMYCVLANVSI
jgi:hypothetical protein